MRRLIMLFAVCVPGIANATFTVSPSSSTSFTAQVGQTSAAQSFTLQETRRVVGDNDETVTFTLSGACGDFTITPATSYIDNECENDGCTASKAPCIEPVAPVILCTPDDADLTVTFHPSVAATENCTVNLTGTLSGTATLSLQGTGTPPPIHVSASPGSINFGGVRTETTSSPVGVTITNSGGSPATISSIATSGTGYAIASGTTGSHTLGAGASEGVTVTCSPGDTVGALGAGNLAINSNDPTTPTINIGLACSGITSKVAVSPSPIVIPTTRVGEPVMSTITFTNTGAATATLSSLTLTGMTMISAPPAGTQLAPNGTATAVISFDATAAGSASGNLHVVTDTSTLDIPITADALVTSMSVSPDGEFDFGPVCSGQTKVEMFSLIANADGPFKLTAVSTPDAPFTAATPMLPASVQGDAGNTVTFSITAAPTDAGSAASSIMLTTDIPNGTPDTIALTVVGLPAGVTVTPPTVDLGEVAIQTTSLGQTISLSNCGDAPITIADATIYGSDAANTDAFSIVQAPQSLMVGANSSVSWLVAMNSQVAGDLNATFEVDYAGGSATVALTGEPYDPNAGSGVDGGSTTDKSSYYACSTGRGAALWPIALALAALRRRKRTR